MADTLRRSMLLEAIRSQVQAGSLLGMPAIVGGAALLTMVTTPWLAPLWLLGTGGLGAGVALSAARGRLRDPGQIPELTRRAILAHHAPRELSADLVPYVNQAIQSAVEVVSQIEQQRDQPIYPALRSVVDTVGALLDQIVALSDRIVMTERLFDSLQKQAKALPASRLQGAAATEFDRNLRTLQSSIDASRQQVVEATGALQRIAVQSLVIQSQDAALMSGIGADVAAIASDQADELQAQIAAMAEVASLTQAATGRLLAP